MLNRSTLQHPVVVFGIPLLILAFLSLLMTSSRLPSNELLYLAISVDLVLIVPFIYFLLIFKTEIPKTTIIPFVVVGLVLGIYLLPSEGQTYLQFFKVWALPIIEVGIVSYVVYSVVKAKRTFKKTASDDFFGSVIVACTAILPRALLRPFATEMAVFYYGFVNWKRRKLEEHEFSYHKETGSRAVLGAFIFAIGIETVALHFLLAMWSELAAWILTTISIYTAIQIFGMARSISKRPVSISSQMLSLKYGILSEVDIRLLDIQEVILSKKPVDEDKTILALSPLAKMEGTNILIKLKKEYDLIGFYGLKKPFGTIAIHLDHPDDFVTRVNSILGD